MWNFAACTRTGIDREKRKRCETAARKDNTNRQSAISLRWLGTWQCGQGQRFELARSSRREVCSPADVDGHCSESTGKCGRNSSKTGRRYSAGDEEHERQPFAADSSDDADAGSEDSSDGQVMNVLKTVLVQVAGDSRSSRSVQLPQIQPQQRPPQNSRTSFAPNYTWV